MDPALIELNEAGPADEEVSLILRLQDGAEPPPIVRVVCRFGPIITVRCRRGDILPTWASDRVISVKAPRAVHLPGPVGKRRAPAEAEIDEAAASEIETDPEDAEAFAGDDPPGRPPPPALPVDGRGVVVGICDWGFDFTHPNFRNADGSTRLIALWDQRGTGDPRAPAPYHRGRLFTPDDINAALARPDPCAALGYHPSSGDPSNTGSHGTHVSDIVAGNRRYPGSEVGLASGADLVFVHLGAQRLGELDNLGDSVGLLEGLDFVRRTAAAAGRPAVLHLSAGKTGGPHCGVTLVERAVDNLLQETPGIVLVQSGGNYADTAMHTHARVGPDQTHAIDWLIPPGDRTPNELEIWYSGMDVFDVTLVAPDGQEFSAPLAQRARLGDGGDAWGNFYHRLHEPNSGFNHVAIFLYTAAPTGRWQVVVHGRDVVDGRLHAWIERDAGSRYQSRFSRAQATSSYTTNTICNSFRAIAVGAYDATHPERPPGHFSSRGPTADGRQKPEIAAPGVRILAARSMPRDGWNGERKLVVKSGTSMAAPWVSGTVALMFQAAGRPLTIHEVRRILIGAADPHAGPRGRSSSQLGFGYLNTAAAVEAARRLGTGAAAAPPPPAAAFSLEQDEAQHDEAQPLGSTWIEVPLGEASVADRCGDVARACNEREEDPPPDIDAAEWREMLELDKREINALLAGIELLPAPKRARYEAQIDKAWGIDPERMRVAFKAVAAKQARTSAKDFAFASWALCRNLYMGQRQSVFRYVEPGLKDPTKIEPGDLVTFKDRRQGVVHRGEIRRQNAKDQVPWMAYNPGGLASAQLLQTTRRYPGKRIDKRLDVFPSYEAGLEGIREFLRVLARKEKHLDRTVEGYFRAHAPAPLAVDPREANDPELRKQNEAQRHATKGNDPELYTNRVLADAGWPQSMRTKKLSALSPLEFETLAKSIARVGEGYCTTTGDRILFTTTETPDPDLCGGTNAKTILWPDSAQELDRDTWWSIVFWEHG
jgi:subtilisin family serine protease